MQDLLMQNPQSPGFIGLAGCISSKKRISKLPMQLLLMHLLFMFSRIHACSLASWSLSKIHALAAVCGTTPFPKSLSLSTLKAAPLTTRPTLGSAAQLIGSGCLCAVLLRPACPC